VKELPMEKLTPEARFRISIQTAVDDFIADSIGRLLKGMYSSIQAVFYKEVVVPSFPTDPSLNKPPKRIVKKRRFKVSKKEKALGRYKGLEPTVKKYIEVLQGGPKTLKEMTRIFKVAESTVTSRVSVINSSGKANIKKIGDVYTLLPHKVK